MKTKFVKISRSDFIKEHRKLIKILKTGNKRGLKQEFRSQLRELKSYLKKK